MTDHDSDDQRLQFHLQLMGRLPSTHSESTTTSESELTPHLTKPLHHHSLHRQSSASTCKFIDPLNSLLADPSPYHHAMLNHQPSSRPSSRASNFSSSAPHGFPPVPLLPICSPSPSLSSRHSTSAHPSPFLVPHHRPSSALSASSFDPDFEAERVRMAKLEQRRSVGMGLNRPKLPKSRHSSASVRSFRSVGPSHNKLQSAAAGKATAHTSVYRPSPLRSTSTPDLGVVETEAEKKKHRKEMKEEYDKMRAARIEEEKRLSQRPRDKSSNPDSHPSWFGSRFKRTTKVFTSQVEGQAQSERLSTSQSSATDSTALSSTAIDLESRSVTTAPTSEEGPIDHSQKTEEVLQDQPEQISSFDSPAVDPFRKSMLPGQVPATPTKLAPKSLTPARNNINKLNRLFDSFKLGGGSHGPNTPANQDTKNRAKISVVESRTPIPSQPQSHVDQAGWLDSFKSIRSKSRANRRRTLVGMFLPEKDLPPPVPKLPEQIQI